MRLLLLLAAWLAPHGQPEPEVVLTRLTGPPAVLGDSCALSPQRSEPAGRTRTRGGLWGPVPIPTNPWVGDDRDRVVGIGEIVVGPEGAPRVPDGPPPDRRRMLELRRTPFDGATGYAAAYRRGDELTFVYALLSDRLEPRVAIGVGDERFEEDVDTGLFRTRGLWVRVLGSRGACFATLTRHVEHALSGVDGPLR